MALPLPPSLSETLAYFKKYAYPLTSQELWYWQHYSSYSKAKVGKLYHPKTKSKLWQTREARTHYSMRKWAQATLIGESLKKFPTIQAVFITGALAMNNCPQDDDIDFMVVTSADTLWITRFLVNIYLHTVRRFPGTHKNSGKACLNLWLDINNLSVEHKSSMYIAHEVLQTKVLWDRANIAFQFLKKNAWAKKFLPTAYAQSIKETSNKPHKRKTNYLVSVCNTLFFVIQWLYMKPKMTSEQVTLGSAFFHPNK